MSSLCDQFRIDENNLARRRALVGLTEDDRQLLLGYADWAARIAPAVARAFYDHQFSLPDLAAFFQESADRRRAPMSQLRRHLEEAQAGYFRQVFEGARDNWGVRYFEQRLRVGVVHDRIDLPFKFYLGSYPTYQRLLRQALVRRHPLRPADQRVPLLVRSGPWTLLRRKWASYDAPFLTICLQGHRCAAHPAATPHEHAVRRP